jgi:putative endonuclease
VGGEIVKYVVYMLTDKQNDKLYIGVTNDIVRRLREHKSEMADSYTKRYHLHKLVYYEEISSPQYAIMREKQLKGWLREKKNALICSVNPNWDDWGAAFL